MMKRLLSFIAVLTIVAFTIILLLSSSQVYTQEIESNNFVHYGGNLYISPQINIMIPSTGQIQWSSQNQSVHFYLIPAGRLSRISGENPAELAIKPVKYADGPDVYLYEGLAGSYYVVAEANSNPSSFASYYFTHSPYVADPAIGGPSSYNTALEVFHISISMVAAGFAMLIEPPAYHKASAIRKNGGSISLSVITGIRLYANILFRAFKAHRITSVIMVAVVLLAGYSVIQATSVPPVLPPISTHSLSNDSLISSGYRYNVIFNESSPLVSAVYKATLIGPLPEDGGINSSQIYNYGYLITITKVSENSSILGASQTIVIRSVEVSIGNMTFPFTLNQWDSGLVYYNGALITGPSGTYDNGTEFGLSINPTNEMSLKIGNGNYTMKVAISLSPVTVLGIYHYPGIQNNISLSYPVYVNNSNTMVNQ